MNSVNGSACKSRKSVIRVIKRRQGSHLKAESLTQSSLARKIGITRQEVGRHVQRLFNVNLIKRKNSGKIALSEYGETILYALSGLDFITSNHDYFQIHRIRHIPRRFFSRLDELTGCILNTDPMSVFHSIQNMSANAQEFIWRMTDKHLNIAHPYHQAAVDRGVQFRLIEPKIYTPAPGVPKSLKVFPSENRRLDHIPLFMAISEKMVSGIGFPLYDGTFDYHCFKSKDSRVIEWSKDVFQYYWDTERPL